MLTTLRDLLRYNVEFRIGAILVGMVAVMAALSFVSPYSPIDTFVVAPDLPPSLAHPFGTTSRGQDVFWHLTFAIRNTLAFGIVVAAISRVLSLTIGLLSGYRGGWVDRVLMSINDTFIVIPLFPILVLFYFVLRDHMSWIALAMIMALLGWAYDARLIRSLALSLKAREFTHTGVFSGMSTREVLVREHLPYVMPIVFATTMNNMNWSIGLEVTLSVLGFTDINSPTIGGMIYWANQHTALVAGVWWWIAFPVVVIVMLFIGLVPARRLHERAHRSAQPAAAAGCRRRGMTAAAALPYDKKRAAQARADDRRPAGRGAEGLLPDTPFRCRARGESRRRRDVRGSQQRDLWAGGRIELRQVHADQGHRRRHATAARDCRMARLLSPSCLAARSCIRRPAPRSPPFAGASSPTSCKAP